MRGIEVRKSNFEFQCGSPDNPFRKRSRMATIKQVGLMSVIKPVNQMIGSPARNDPTHSDIGPDGPPLIRPAPTESGWR